MVWGFWAPTLKELNYKFNLGMYRIEGNPNLRPETSVSYNAELSYAMTRHIVLRVSGYHHKIRDKINRMFSHYEGMAYQLAQRPGRDAEKFNNAPMPNLGITDTEAEALYDYIVYMTETGGGVKTAFKPLTPEEYDKGKTSIQSLCRLPRSSSLGSHRAIVVA